MESNPNQWIQPPTWGLGFFWFWPPSFCAKKWGRLEPDLGLKKHVILWCEWIVWYARGKMLKSWVFVYYLRVFLFGSTLRLSCETLLVCQNRCRNTEHKVVVSNWFTPRWGTDPFEQHTFQLCGSTTTCKVLLIEQCSRSQNFCANGC